MRCALLLSVLGLATAAFGQPTVVDLGQWNGSAPYVRAVSADGSVVVGGTSLSLGDGIAVRWTSSGGWQGLGALPGGYSSHSFAVSADGSIAVGWSTYSVPSEPPHAFRWILGSGMQDLGIGVAYGVSADGSVIVGRSGANAFRWTAATGVGLLTDSYDAAALAVSADGSTAVGYAITPGFERAFRWVVGRGGQNLGTLPGGGDSYATAVSGDSNVVIGYVVYGIGNLVAFRWTAAEGMVSLGSLPCGTVYPNAVSGNGTMMVGGSAPIGEGAPGLLWSPSLGMTNLNTQLAAHGADLSGWVLYAAVAITPDGSAMAGNGNLNGNERAWLVTGVPSPLLPLCYANCDGSMGSPVLNVADFTCFLQKFATGDPYANCDGSCDSPYLNVADFTCFLQKFAVGCS